MMIVRALLIVICGLFVLLLLALALIPGDQGPGERLGMVVASGFFVVLILILGPFWPNAEKTQKLKLALDRYPRAKAYVHAFVVGTAGAVLLLRAWDFHVKGSHNLGGLEKLVVTIAGPSALPVVLGVAGLYCLWKVLRCLVKARGTSFK
jgi:asparagine N-glycosylation enzyme membrane subunit Stt3